MRCGRFDDARPKEPWLGATLGMWARGASGSVEETGFEPPARYFVLSTWPRSGLKCHFECVFGVVPFATQD